MNIPTKQECKEMLKQMGKEKKEYGCLCQAHVRVAIYNDFKNFIGK